MEKIREPRNTHAYKRVCTRGHTHTQVINDNYSDNDRSKLEKESLLSKLIEYAYGKNHLDPYIVLYTK